MDGLSAAGADLLWAGGQLRRLRQCFPPGADPPVLRPDPQRRRAEFPPPDAGGGAPAAARRLVPDQRQTEDVVGLPAARQRCAERVVPAGERGQGCLCRPDAEALRGPQCASRPDQPVPGRQLLPPECGAAIAGHRAGLQPPGRPSGGWAQGDRVFPRGDDAAHRTTRRQA
ncbi:hypothetical protein D9M73_177760 [compost metagenome]